MPLETGNYISDLVATNPLGSDQKSTADDHIRLTKSVLKASFPNVNGAVNPTPTEFNYLVGVTSGIQAQIAAKGAITGQTWTGSHNFPTQSQGNNSTLAATTSYVDTGLATKGAITGQAWSGTHTFPTQAANDNSTKVATTAYADASKSIGDWVRLSTATASASATIDFTGLSSTYDLYLIEILSAKPVTNGVDLNLQTSSNNGVSYDATASNYLGVTHYAFSTSTGAAAINGSSASLTTLAISNAREGYSGLVYISNPSATARCHIRSQGQYYSSGSLVENLQTSAFYRDSATAVNAIRLLMSGGNIASGTFNLYGRKKS